MAEAVTTKTTPDKGTTQVQERPKERPQSFAPSGLGADILALHDSAGNQAVSAVLRNGNGRPLDSSVRAFMESRFNHDFSQVRVHTDAAAAQSADNINANAYTVGNNVVFGPGKFNAQTTTGRHLLAHELSHVVQQSRGGAPPELNAAMPHEQHAAAAAQTFTMSSSRVNVHGRTGIGLARDTKGESHPLPAAEPEDLWRQIQGLRGFDATDPAHALETAKDQVTRLEGELKLKPDDKALQKQLEKARKSLAQTQKRQAGPIDPQAKGKPLGTGYSTYAAVQVLDADGKQVAVGIGKYDGTNHAEENAIKALRANLKGKSITGGRLMVVVDQVVCSKCQGSLKSFVGERGLTHIDAYYPARGEVTPKTAARTSVKKGNETTLRHEVISGEGSKQVSPTPKPQSAGSKPTPTPAAAKSPQTVIPPKPKAPTDGAKPSIPKGAGGDKLPKLPKEQLRSLGAKFRGGARSAGGAIAALLANYLIGKWRAEVTAQQIKDSIKRLEPMVMEKLKKSLAANADDLLKLYKEDPEADIYVNIRYRIGMLYDSDPTVPYIGGIDVDMFFDVELDDAAYSRKPWDSAPSYSREMMGCTGHVEWETQTISEKIPVKDFFGL